MKSNRNITRAHERAHDHPTGRAHPRSQTHSPPHADARAQTGTHVPARGTPAPGRLFREWQDADAQASAARRRVRLACVADGHGVSDADVCDALLKERRANALAEQLLERFGPASTAPPQGGQ